MPKLLKILRVKSFLTSLSILLCLLSVTLLPSCAKRGEVKPDGRPPYAKVIVKWTSEGSVYRGIESRLILHATYRGLEFREAYAREYGERYRLDGYRIEKLVEQERKEHERADEFFLAVSTPDEGWNDLERDDSIWRLYLKSNSGERVEPVAIRRVDEESPLFREFYPKLDQWSRGYIVSFPKYSATGERPLINDDTSRFTLIITGLLGHTEIEWQME
ncbi:MAG: hypothetical protein ACE5D4_07200 [Thermodesulfobacteriota bacterium]